MLASDFPSENPRTQTRNFSYTNPLCTTRMKHCQIITSTTFASQDIFEKILEETFNLTKVSIQLLIKNKFINESNSDLAIKINRYFQKGKVLPDQIIIELIKEKLPKIENGILIQGYPRTKKQLNLLTELLKKHGFEIDRLWILELQNLDKLISEYENENLTNQIIEKFKLTINQNRKIEKLIGNSKITSKINFDYPINWKTEKIKAEIMAMHNTG